MARISIELYKRAKLKGDDSAAIEWAVNAHKDVQGMFDMGFSKLTRCFITVHESILMDICKTRRLANLYGKG